MSVLYDEVYGVVCDTVYSVCGVYDVRGVMCVCMWCVCGVVCDVLHAVCVWGGKSGFKISSPNLESMWFSLWVEGVQADK